MSKSTSIKLGEHFESFIAKKLEDGSYKNASELIREGLRKVEEEDTKLEALRKILNEGRKDIEEGRYTIYQSVGELKQDIDKALEARLNK